MRKEEQRRPIPKKGAGSGTTGGVRTGSDRKRLLFLLLSLGFGTMFLLSPRPVGEAVGRAFSLCVGTLLPTLFPFLVLSGIALRCGLGTILASVTGRWFSFLFGIEGAGSASFLLGLVCGAPTGTRVAHDLVESGACTGEEGGRLIAFCPPASPAFLIAGVGASMLGSRTEGICLWLCQTLGVILTGMLLKRLPRRKGSVPEAERKREAAERRQEKPFSASEVLTSSLAAAVETMPGIFGSVLFFSAVTAVLSPLFAVFPPVLRAFLFSLLEITGGIDGAVSAPIPRRLTLMLCGFASGFGGLSIACQVQTIAAGRVPLRAYLPAKAVCGILTALLAAWIP